MRSNIKGFMVHGDAVVHMLTNGPKTVRVESQIPTGARHRWTYFSQSRGCLVIVMEHWTFDEVPLGDPIPLDPTVITFTEPVRLTTAYKPLDNAAGNG